MVNVSDPAASNASSAWDTPNNAIAALEGTYDSKVISHAAAVATSAATAARFLAWTTA